MTAPPLVCRDAVELASDYLEGALARRDRRRFERHLANCDGCTAYLEQLRETIAASGRAAPEDLSPEALDGLVDLYRRVRGGTDPDRRQP
ncbi:MAG: anti-sigma factor family protein [Acidimicrobiales bacterium]